MFFGNKKPERESVLLLDVESGSVGSALAINEPGLPTKVFGEARFTIPIMRSRSSRDLLPQVERAVRDALVHTAQMAGRLRINQNVSDLGNLSHAAVFLSSPWAAPNLGDNTNRFSDVLTRTLESEIAGYHNIPAHFYTGADAAAFGVRRILHESILLCVVRGETAELLLINDSGVAGYATMPTGINTVIRTLKAHGGMSDAEVNSMFTLAAHPNAQPFEALEASATNFVEEFAGAAQHLLGRGETVNGVFVVAQEPVGEWFARALGSDESLGDYFPEGSWVRALKAHQLAGDVSAHLAAPDLNLLLLGLFVGQKYNQKYN